MKPCGSSNEGHHAKQSKQLPPMNGRAKGKLYKVIICILNNNHKTLHPRN